MKTLLHTSFSAALAAALLSVASASIAAEPATAASAPKAPMAAAADPSVTSEAQAVVERMTKYLRSLTTFSIDSVGSRDEIADYGFKVQHNEHVTMAVSMPDKLRADVVGDLHNRTFVYDGKTLVLYSPDDAAYVRVKTPDRLLTVVDDLLDAGVEMPLIDMLYQAGRGTLTDAVERGVLLGDANVDGSECDHLAFRQANIDWQLWVQKGDRPLPRKLVITTRYEAGEPQFETTLRWDLKPKIDASTFVFAPPKDVSEIAFANKAAFETSAP